MPSRRRTPSTAPVWVKVCAYEALEPDVGVAALVKGKQVALFRLSDGTLYAVGNRDPFSGLQSMARGVVGLRDGMPFVAAPRGREIFDLTTGRCTDDPTMELHSYQVRVVDGTIEVCVNVRN
ncbi:MAG: nitrite reductase [Nocardioidaceae bacterium]|nr:nitrite reductase [Nocardioidaceae bacterium]